MIEPNSETALSETLTLLAADARSRDIPIAIVEEATCATLRRFAPERGRTEASRLVRRAEAYFSAVVKRRIVRGRATSRVAARMVASAVAADMRQGGRDAASIRTELEASCILELPAHVAQCEERQLRLCG